MGSYLSVVNNTSDTWVCKVGPDEAALKIAGMAITAVGTAIAVIGTAGAAAPAAAALVTGGVSVFGVSTAALATITAGAASIGTATGVVGGVSSFGIAVANGINSQLKDKGYQEIRAGQENRYGKFSLSLWQQGTCVRAYIVDERTVRTETLYMRPIFSGSTDKSTRKHEIQFWINKFGTKKSDVVAKIGDKARSIEDGDVYIGDDGAVTGEEGETAAVDGNASVSPGLLRRT